MFYWIFLALWVSTVHSFNLDELQTGVWLCGAAYCKKQDYPTMKIAGLGSGFVFNQTLYNKKTDIQGYIGTLPSSKSIYTVIRGSSSTLNWLDDFEIRLVPYKTFPECNCNVHHGFYETTLEIRDQVIHTVQNLKLEFPDYKVIVTGHSLGAAISQFLGLELIHAGIDATVYNYGQPRLGDLNFAVFVDGILKQKLFRMTHYKDWVPHAPPRLLDYHHSCLEIYEDQYQNIRPCLFSCEDPTCSNRFPIKKTNGHDHEVYLNHSLHCVTSILK